MVFLFVLPNCIMYSPIIIDITSQSVQSTGVYSLTNKLLLLVHVTCSISFGGVDFSIVLF